MKRRKSRSPKRAIRHDGCRFGVEMLETRAMLTTCPNLCGDANLDGNVDFDDFIIVQENFGSEGSWGTGDFDGDNVVKFPDFLILSENYGNSIGAASRITQQSVVDAARLIQEGKRYSLAYVLENGSPTNPFVSHELSLDLEVRFPESANDFVALAESVDSNFMHVGTQFDLSLIHI